MGGSDGPRAAGRQGRTGSGWHPDLPPGLLLGSSLAATPCRSSTSPTTGPRRAAGRPPATWSRTLRDARAVRDRARGQDIVHIHTALAPTVTVLRAALLAVAARSRGCAVVVHAHGGGLQSWLADAVGAPWPGWPCARRTASSRSGAPAASCSAQLLAGRPGADDRQRRATELFDSATAGHDAAAGALRRAADPPQGPAGPAGRLGAAARAGRRARAGAGRRHPRRGGRRRDGGGGRPGRARPGCSGPREPERDAGGLRRRRRVLPAVLVGGDAAVGAGGDGRRAPGGGQRRR